MAEPQDSYPDAATNAARKAETNGDGEAALRDALAAHGDDLAGLIERTDELDDALATAILVAASADDDELDHITASTANLIEAVDGLSTEGTAELAADVGESADDLSAALETVLELQREGHLEELVELAAALSELEIDEDAVAGLNDLLGAVGEAQRESEPVGLLGFIGRLGSRDVRAGLGYVVAILKAQGRRLRGG